MVRLLFMLVARRSSLNFKVYIFPIISDDWESDEDSCQNESSPEELNIPEVNSKNLSSSMRVQYDPTPESLKEKKLILKNGKSKKKLCRTCTKKVSEEETVLKDDHLDNHSQKVKFQDLYEKSNGPHRKDSKSDDVKLSSKSNSKEVNKKNIEEQIKEDSENIKLLMKSMKPVPAFVRKHIYKDISHNGNGRMKYLNMRYRVPPEDRWYHPVTSSMEYGWTWGYPPEIKCPEFGRKMVVFQSFFRVKGIELKP
ncbi:uncharacterized protein NPIL_229271 [Nephila pilipes]|uniref:Sperm microtubule inner protein 1 C-terminal domain-containing protein n=1 Tax=Nephila pilipes TaxID=299642 RepID=A0A8X6IVP0_NEPPI|nr:uncharacterized protein NPIL_229271 [Nephila pilipes]